MKFPKGTKKNEKCFSISHQVLSISYVMRVSDCLIKPNKLNRYLLSQHFEHFVFRVFVLFDNFSVEQLLCDGIMTKWS